MIYKENSQILSKNKIKSEMTEYRIITRVKMLHSKIYVRYVEYG